MVTLATPRPERRNKQTASLFGKDTVNEQELKELRFRITHNLQTSLDLQSTIGAFFDNIQDLVPTSGLIYRNFAENVEIPFGKCEAHTASYKIAAQDAQLGQIVFSRDHGFIETELAALEMLIGMLFLPLRNALMYREALESSMRDPLTGIGNRAAMNQSFEREIKLARRHKHSLAMLLIDVDHFKEVNDNLGHQNGDVTLQQVVKITQDTLRETDQIYRYGGEEFVALLTNTSGTDAKLIAERIRVNIAMSPIALESQDLQCTVSVGVSKLVDEDDIDSLFKRADDALYVAKGDGRNRVELAKTDAKANTTKKRKTA